MADTNLSHHQRARNTMTLRFASVLAIAVFGAFWALDWFVMPDHAMLSGLLRLIACSYAAVLLWLTYHRRRFVAKYCEALMVSLPVVIIWAISIMCWVHDGYESPYYAGINTVLIVVGMMFSWERRTAIVFHSLVYSFYMLPLIFGYLHIQSLGMFMNNQFFLLAAMLLTAISQNHRVNMEKREYRQRKTMKEYVASMRRFATMDSLTGISNRRYLLTLGEREFRRCERYKRAFSAILVDIDHFKRINDTYSHRVGDEVIQGVAAILKKSVRSIDIVGRYGGEEFLILLPEADTQQAIEVVASRIQEAIKKDGLNTSIGGLNVTLSLGVSGRRSEAIDLNNLIHRADIALYSAKRSGRNRIVEWDTLMESKAA